MPSLAEQPIVDHLEKLTEQSLSLSPAALESFAVRVDHAILNLRALARWQAKGKQLILSVDLCELIDSSVRFLMYEEEFLERRLVSRRRVFTDIAFAKLALRQIRHGLHNFTLLPGTILETLSFLRDAIGRDHNLGAQLGRFLARIEQQTMADAEESAKFNRKAETFYRARSANLAVFGGLAALVTELIYLNNYRSPQQVEGSFGYSEAEFSDLLAGVSGVRARASATGWNDVFDAANLATAINVAKQETSDVVVHVTRTPSLHRLSEGNDLEIDLSLRWTEDDFQYPLLVKPDVVFLLGQLFPQGSQRVAGYSAVEEFCRQWGEFSSRLREGEITRGGEAQLAAALPRLLRGRETGAVLPKVLDLYIAAFLESTALAGQLQAAMDEEPLDFMYQEKEIRRANREAVALGLDDQFNAFLDLIDQRTGIRRAINISSSLPIHPLARVSELDLHGFFPFQIARAEPNLREFVLSRHEPKGQTLGELLASVEVGLQVGLFGSSCSGVLFWPRPLDIEMFLGAARRFLEGTLSGERVVAIVATQDDEITIRELTGEEELFSEVLLGVVGKPVNILQLHTGRGVLTWELALEDRPAFLSIRFDVPPDLTRIGTLYQDTRQTLPASLVMEFVAKYWHLAIGVVGPDVASVSSAR